MATTTITAADLARADEFLTAYLTENVPDADFSYGSAVRDLVVKSIAYLYAYLEKERQTARDHASLLKLAALPPSEDVDAAVDAYLSNLFITRKKGEETRIPVLLHFSQPTDVVLGPLVRFFRTASLVFVPDLSDTAVIPASDLRLVTNPDGTRDWTYTQTCVAVERGVDYNVPPGRFTAVDRFNPFFTHAENISEGVGGRNPETTAELLKRAPTALSTRNLVNERSVNAVLFEKFPALERALTVGMGDPEMLRDLSTEAATRLRVHLGGHTDVYLGLPRAEVITEARAGDFYARGDGRVAILRDTEGAVFGGVRPGHVLSVTSGVRGAPRQVVITRATADEIEVATPFPAAANVTYSIGSLAPDFRDIVASRTTGVASGEMHEPSSVFLGGPVYRVKKVEVGAEPTIVPTRVNRTPQSADEYQVTVLNPEAGQSVNAVTAVRLHESLADMDVRLTYDALVGYANVQTYINGRFDRVINANHLARGYNPIYVSASIEYSRKFGAKESYTAEDIAARVAAFINGFDWTNTLDVSAISADLMTSFPAVGIVYPFTLKYTLYAPDGQVLTYESPDIATVFPRDGTNARLTNGPELTQPIMVEAYQPELEALLAKLGVTDRTVRYFADLADVTVKER